VEHNRGITPTLLDGVIKARAWSIRNPYNGLDYLEVEWYEAEFLVDFGPWKAGYVAHTLTFNPFGSCISETNHDEYLVASCAIEVSPRADHVAP
jgi:hypothetical protein